MGPASRAKVAAAFLALYVIWGSTYLGIRIAVETLPPFLMAGVRFSLAGAILYTAARLRGSPRPRPHHWATTGIVGACLLLGGNGGVVWAARILPSGILSLLVAMTPVWMVAIDWLRRGGVRPGPRVLYGLLMGSLGMGLLVGPEISTGEGGLHPAGVTAVLAATLFWASGSIYSRHASLPASSLLATAMEMLAGGAFLLIAGLLAGEAQGFRLDAVSARSAAAFVYLLVFGSLVSFTAYIWLLQVSSPARVSTYAYVNPVVAVFLGWAFEGEELTPGMLAAAAIIIAGVALITMSRRSGESPPSTPSERAAPEDLPGSPSEPQPASALAGPLDPVPRNLEPRRRA